MATKLGRMVTYYDGLLPIKSHDHMTNSNNYIYTTTVPMATKLGRIVTSP